MSLKDKFEAIKSAIHNAMNFAEPEEVLRKAEHEFKEGIVAEFEAVHAKLKALEEKVFGPGEGAALPPLMTAAQVASALPPADVALANVNAVPAGAGLVAPAENAQPAVAENTGSGAAPVDPVASPATDSAGVSIPAAGTAPEDEAQIRAQILQQMKSSMETLEKAAFATPATPQVFDGILPKTDA